ncbi:MAG TPA: hypothetical protein PKH46_06005 [Candidatus Cryosericum sp.]|nr:hypothetical protein [Candidatus Cryosericum sp.]
MSWTGNVVTDLNYVLLNADRDGVEPLKNYDLALFDRIRKTAKKENIFLGAGGRGAIRTNTPSNARTRVEAEDMPYPEKYGFQRFTFDTHQYVATVGLTQEDINRTKNSDNVKQSVIDMAEFLQEDAVNVLSRKLNMAMKGDGTGRLALVSGSTDSANTTFTITYDNKAATFGWDTSQMMEDGIRVDVLNLNSSTWTYKLENVVVSNVTSTGCTLTVDSQSTYTADPADNDFIFAAKAATVSAGAITYREMQGLMAICDDGTSSFSSMKGGCFKGTTFQGLNRTSYPQLKASVYDYSSGGTAGTWDWSDIMDPIDESDGRANRNKVSAVYCNHKMMRALSRKAAAEMNAIVVSTDNSVTGSWYTKAINTGKRVIPIIQMNTLPNGMVFGVAEDDLVLYQPVPIDWVEMYGSKPFFDAPAARNRTKEAWLAFEGELIATRCDNCFRIQGLATDE